MEGGATGSPQEAGAGWDGRPEPRQGLKGAYLRLHLTHTFHRKSTRKGTFDLGGRSGRRRRCRRRPSLPCILQESRGHRRPLRRRVRSRPRWEQPGLGTRPPPAAGPRQPPRAHPLQPGHSGHPVPAPAVGSHPIPPAAGHTSHPVAPRQLLCSHGGRGCPEGLSEKREQEAWSAGWSRTGSWAWRCVPVALCPCVPWRPRHPRKAACLSLPPCKVGVLGRYLGVLWRLMASRGSNHPQPLPSHLLNPLALPFKFSELRSLVFQPVFPPDSKRLVTK